MNARQSFHRRSTGGATLIELLIVVAIIGLLLQLLLPAVEMARESARRTQCANNLRQIGLATVQFHDVHQKFPPGRWKNGSATWFVLLLPYLEAEDAYAMWSLEGTYYDHANERARKTSIPQWRCPSRSHRPQKYSGENRDNAEGAVGDYAGNIGDHLSENYDPEANGIITTSSLWDEIHGSWNEYVQQVWDSDVTLARVIDGTSHTILAGDKHVIRTELGQYPADSSLYNGDHAHTFGRAAGPDLPLAGARDPCHGACARFGSWHPGLCQFVLVDGSVHTLSVDVDEETLRRLCDRADGLSVTIAE